MKKMLLAAAIAALALVGAAVYIAMGETTTGQLSNGDNNTPITY